MPSLFDTFSQQLLIGNL